MLVLAALGAALAFYTGARWQHARAAWTDHRDQRAKEQRLRRARWAPWWELAVPAGALAVALWVIIAVWAHQN